MKKFPSQSKNAVPRMRARTSLAFVPALHKPIGAKRPAVIDVATEIDAHRAWGR